MKTDLAWRTEKRKVNELIPWEGNPRKMSEKAVADLTKSLQKFNLMSIPVIDQDGMIVSGHQRVRILQMIGRGGETIDVRVPNRKLTEEEFQEANIRENKNIGEWEIDLLAAMDHGLLLEAGFDKVELDTLFNLTIDIPHEIPETLPPEKLPENPATKPGDIYVMGNHRLMCGDCRSPEDMKKMMGALKATVIVTSPPYASQRKYDEKSEFIPVPPDGYIEWYKDVARNMAVYLAEEGSYFLNLKEHCEEGERHLYVKRLTIAHVDEWGWRFVDEFAWVHGGTPRRVDVRFKNGWEPIFQFTRGPHKFRPDNVTHESDAIPDWSGLHPNMESVQKHGHTEGMERKGVDPRKKKKRVVTKGSSIVALDGGLAYPSNVLSLGKNMSAVGHSAAYPVSLPEFFIKAFSDPCDIILDPFAGSGSTLIAAETHGRFFCGMEISPRYCDVIVKRWQEQTGKAAVKSTE